MEFSKNYEKNTNKKCNSYVCELCHYKSNHKTNYIKHLNTIKHKSKNDEKLMKVMKKSSNKNNKYIYICNNCDYRTNKKINYLKHLNTEKHKSRNKLQKVESNDENSINTYICEICDYISNDNSNYKKHLKTEKHKNKQKEVENSRKKQDLYVCEKCNYKTVYKYNYNIHLKSLKHKKNNDVKENQPEVLMNVITKLVEQNDKMFEQNGKLVEQNNKMMELAIESKNINNSHNNNNNNNTFNLNTFLNVHCKNAENIDEFISKINYDIKKLVVNNTTDFFHYFCNPITSKPQHLRPIHCTDVKRNSIIVKKEDKWIKDMNMFSIIHDMRERIYSGIINLKTDEWMNNDKLCEKRKDALVYAGNMNENKQHQYNKIKSYICKNTTIDKNAF